MNIFFIKILLLKTIIVISSSYFLVDIYLIKDKHYLDIIHHLLSLFAIYLYYNNIHEDIIIRLFNYSEISNIALFGHYIVKKNIINKKCIYISSIFEFFIYSYYRIFLTSIVLFDNYSIILCSFLSPLLIIYCMSIDWYFKLLQDLIHNFLNI